MKVTNRKGKAYIKLRGALSITEAAAFKTALVDSLNSMDAVEINLDEVESIDLACLQLLCSAHRTAANKGKQVAVKMPLPSPFLEAREKAGFVYTKQCRFVSTNDCLWVVWSE